MFLAALLLLSGCVLVWAGVSGRFSRWCHAVSYVPDGLHVLTGLWCRHRKAGWVLLGLVLAWMCRWYFLNIPALVGLPVHIEAAGIERGYINEVHITTKPDYPEAEQFLAAWVSACRLGGFLVPEEDEGEYGVRFLRAHTRDELLFLSMQAKAWGMDAVKWYIGGMHPDYGQTLYPLGEGVR